METKFIIIKDQNRLRHFKCDDNCFHSDLAKMNGYGLSNVIESGLIIDGKIIILDCTNNEHITHREYLTFENIRDNYIREQRAREIETFFAYNKQMTSLKNGD